MQNQIFLLIVRFLRENPQLLQTLIDNLLQSLEEQLSNQRTDQKTVSE